MPETEIRLRLGTFIAAVGVAVLVLTVLIGWGYALHGRVTSMETSLSIHLNYVHDPRGAK